MNKPDGMERGKRATALRNGLSHRVRVAVAVGAWVLYALAFIPWWGQWEGSLVFESG